MIVSSGEPAITCSELCFHSTLPFGIETPPLYLKYLLGSSKLYLDVMKSKKASSAFVPDSSICLVNGIRWDITIPLSIRSIQNARPRPSSSTRESKISSSFSGNSCFNISVYSVRKSSIVLEISRQISKSIDFLVEARRAYSITDTSGEPLLKLFL